MGIYIESINFQNGDRDLNNLIQNNLKRYQRTKLNTKYDIEGNTKYEKTISKDETEQQASISLKQQ